MSPMNRAARRELPLLILFFSCSARLFAAPLFAHPLGISTGANTLHEVSSGSPRFWLTSGLGGTEISSAVAGKGTAGDGATSSAGAVGVPNGPKSGGGSVGSVGGSASDQGSAHTGEATSGTQSTGQAADTGWVGHVTNHPDWFGAEMETAKGRNGWVNPADGANQFRMRADDPAGKNWATAGQVSFGAGGSGAWKAAGAVADASSGSHAPSNTQGKGTTDPTAPVPSLAPSSPTLSSQQAATPPGQSGSAASSLANQAISNSQGASYSPPSGPALSSQQAATPPGQSGSAASSLANQAISNSQGASYSPPSGPALSSQQAATPPGQSGSAASSLANQAISNPQGASYSPPSGPALSSQLNSAGPAPITAGAGTPAASSSSAAPLNSAGATAVAAAPQSVGSPPPASGAGPAGAPSTGSTPLANGSSVAQSPQSSSPSTVSIAPATAVGGSANPSGVSSPDDHLAAQILISLSPSLSNVLGGAGSTVGTTSNPVSTTSATSALSTGGTSSSTPLSGSLASSDLPLPSVEASSQILADPVPDATSTGLVMGILPQNIPEPRVLDMLVVLVTALALRRMCEHGVPGVRSA